MIIKELFYILKQERVILLESISLSFVLTIVSVLLSYTRFKGLSFSINSIYFYSTIFKTALIFLFLFIFFSFFFAYNEFVKKFIYICPSCEEAKQIKLKKGETTTCLKCHVKMVPLKGFYDKKKEDEKDNKIVS